MSIKKITLALLALGAYLSVALTQIDKDRSSSGFDGKCLPYSTPYQPLFDADLSAINQYNKPPGYLDTIQRILDTASWRVFIAINWPITANNTVDSTNCIGNQGDNTTVWETWKSSSEVFLPGGAAPTPWGVPTPVPGFCQTNNISRALFKLSKTDEALSDIVEPGDHGVNGGPLVDLNGNYTRFEVKMNKPTFDYIIANQLYSKAGQGNFFKTNPNGSLTLPRGCRTDSLGFSRGVGSIMVKAAWKIMGAGDDTTRFHTTRAWIVNIAKGDTTCTLMQVGLVALHIVHRTCEAPTGTWSTFEHVDNVPALTNEGVPVTDRNKYNYFNAACTGCAINAPSANQKPNPNQKGVPNQVARTTPIEPRVQQLNAYFQQMLSSVNPKSVWQYYQLVGTQWPTMPSPGQSGYPFKPTILANTALESYIQPTSSCMDCHMDAMNDNLKYTDFSFQFSNAQ